MSMSTDRPSKTFVTVLLRTKFLLFTLLYMAAKKRKPSFKFGNFLSNLLLRTNSKIKFTIHAVKKQQTGSLLLFLYSRHPKAYNHPTS